MQESLAPFDQYGARRVARVILQDSERAFEISGCICGERSLVSRHHVATVFKGALRSEQLVDRNWVTLSLHRDDIQKGENRKPDLRDRRWYRWR